MRRPARWIAATTLTAAAAATSAGWPRAAGQPAPAGRPVAAAAPAVAEADRPAATLRAYDVSDFTRPTPRPSVVPSVVPPSMLGERGALNVVPDDRRGQGLFQKDDEKRDAAEGTTDVKTLVDLIRAQVDRDSWAEAGSLAVVNDGLLLVRQTPANHRRIDELLASLRAGTQTNRGVELTARWLVLTPEEAKGLLKAGGDVDPAALEALPERAVYARSTLRTIAGRPALLLAGRARTVVWDQIPSVGQAVAAYDPEVALVLAGTAVRASVRLAGDAATIDLLAVAADWDRLGPPSVVRTRGAGTFPATQAATRPAADPETPPDPPEVLAGGRTAPDAEAEVDRIATALLHVQTLVRLRLGRPAAVGGASLEPRPNAANANDRRQIVLVLQVTSADAPAADAKADDAKAAENGGRR
ncbi:MAG TPA: hypothetical protein VF796_24815 [Humisphaera sp.]